MSRQVDPADEELLQAALSSSFTKLPPPPAAAAETQAPAAPAEPPAPEPVAPDASASVDDSWKDEYDRRLAAWRAESAVAREKAERTRAEWEERRKAEEAEERTREAERKKAQRTNSSSMSGWETVSPADDGASPSSSKPVPGASTAGGVPTTDEKASAKRIDAAQAAVQKHEQTFGRELATPEPSPADARDLTSNERPYVPGRSGLNFPVSSPATSRPLQFDSEPPTSDDEQRISHQWEEVPSLASSFPSLPDNVPSSASSQHGKATSATTKVEYEKAAEHVHHHHHHHNDPNAPATSKDTSVAKTPAGPPPSLTLSIFGAGLSPRARALAVVSSVAINFLLPFVNGVMLGFGEIFARTFVAPLFGIRIPSVPSVAGVGIRAATLERAKR